MGNQTEKKMENDMGLGGLQEFKELDLSCHVEETILTNIYIYVYPFMLT